MENSRKEGVSYGRPCETCQLALRYRRRRSLRVAGMNSFGESTIDVFYNSWPKRTFAQLPAPLTSAVQRDLHRITFSGLQLVGDVSLRLHVLAHPDVSKQLPLHCGWKRRRDHSSPYLQANRQPFVLLQLLSKH